MLAQCYFIGWLFWDPSRELFNVPIIDRPLGWYGLLFVTGLIISYLMTVRLFRQKFLTSPTIPISHIQDWPNLLLTLQRDYNRSPQQFEEVFNYFDKKTLKIVTSFKKGMDIDDTAKHSIIHALNQTLKSPFVESLPIASISELIQPEKTLLKWPAKALSSDQQRIMHNRLYLESLFSQALTPVKGLCNLLVDRLSWFVVAGIVIGARLGHVFFYDWPFYKEHPEFILRVWEGGLASHGGIAGVFIALLFYKRYLRNYWPSVTFVQLVDLLCLPAGLASFCIRLGNFFNQEILGNPTSLPWGIIFGHPADHSPIVPRHPVQLYEALCYLIIFIFLCTWYSIKGSQIRQGLISGVFFVLTFTARFLIEFLKTPQSMQFDESTWQVGQLLSIPFILLGLLLIMRKPSSPKVTLASL